MRSVLRATSPALAFLSGALSGCGSAPAADQAAGTNGTVFMVESIPYNTSIELIDGARNTWELLTAFTNAAKDRIDLSAMYWNLLAKNQAEQKRNFTADEFLALGSDRGQGLYAALLAAAERGVKLRVLNGHGIGSSADSQILDIAAKYPNSVEVRTWNADDWYGGGIMHMKIWVFDHDKVYLGSSNMDWLSLTQVKEMGVGLEGSAGFVAAQDLRKLFDRWWLWTAPSGGPPKQTNEAWDPTLQVTRQVPCWEQFAAVRSREGQCAQPFKDAPKSDFTIDKPMPLVLNGSTGSSFFSCSPPAVCDEPVAINGMFAQSAGGRPWDGDALIQTILSAQESISLSVMDYVPGSIYKMTFNPVYWAELDIAITAKLRQGVRVRMLISRWAHTDEQQWAYLGALQSLAVACQPTCKGALEIRAFEIPGWDKTVGPQAEYPPFTRVNHAKYIVTDKRFNIGTSNMVWSYFHTTAGSSFNSDHAALRQQLQAAFDRDWTSPYAKAVPPASPPTSVSQANVLPPKVAAQLQQRPVQVV